MMAYFVQKNRGWNRIWTSVTGLSQICMFCGIVSACWQPLPQEPEQLMAPQILWDFTDPPDPSFTLQESQDKEFTIWAMDPDSTKLYARFFLERQWKNIIHEEEITNKINGLFKSRKFKVVGLCGKHVNNGKGTYILELYVADQPFVTGTDEEREPTKGGLWDGGHWKMECISNQP